MAKYIVDSQKITNIANSIRNKKGVTTQFDIDEMPLEIDSLSKGGAKIITNKKEGTQIPNTGYIEKIYFNINLSVEETEKILSQLTYSVIGSRWHFYSVIDTSEKITSGKKSISIDKLFENGIPVMYQIMERDSELVIYNSSTGWNKEYSFIEINDNIFSVGNQNDLLKNIISETSFVSKEIELEGTYDGTPIEITENKVIDMKSYLDNKQLPLEVNVNIQSSGGEINGLIEEYKVYAGETINAGDFVEFINNVCKHIKGNFIRSTSCVLLENNKVFIAHSYNSMNYLSGTIVEIDGTNMTATSTQLSSVTYSGNYTSCVLLENNKVFIAHNYDDDYFLYGTIVEINGTDMTATSTQLSSNSNSSSYNSCVLLENNKVFIAHSYDDNDYLSGTIVEIDGTNMTATSKKLSSVKRSVYTYTSCVLLENNKVFIAHCYDSSYQYLYGTIVEINGTDMTATSKKLNDTRYSCYKTRPSCVLLENNKVFIAHSYLYEQYLSGTIVEIDGTNMTATTTQLSSVKNSVYTYNSCVLLENNKVFIAHSYDSNNYYLYGTIVEINGTDMTATSKKLNDTIKGGYYTSCVLLENNKVFIAHVFYNENDNLYGTIYFGDVAKQLTNTINGVAKTSGTEGQIIQVYVPNKE